MKDKASSVKVELPHNNLTRGGHILHEKEYNTGHSLSAIPDEIHREIRREPCLPEAQQEPVVPLLLEGPLGWECSVPDLPVPAASQPPQPAHRGRAKTNPRYAPPQSRPGYGGAVAPSAEARLYPPAREPVSSHAEVGTVSCI